MSTETLARNRFAKWELGEYQALPISDQFNHTTSPFGIINGKEQYVDVVSANKDKFLGYRFEIHDEIYGNDVACVRYKAIQGSFELEVSEWYYVQDNQIQSIVSYYHIGEISEDRKLTA